MEKNIKLLNETLAFIKANPALHNQGDWVEVDENNIEACDTPMCFAGHAALLSGATFDKEIYTEDWEWTVHPETGEHISYDDDMYNGGVGMHVSNYAARKLGLNSNEASYLFFASRSGEELEEAVHKFSEGYSVDEFGDFYKKEI